MKKTIIEVSNEYDEDRECSCCGKRKYLYKIELGKQVLNTVNTTSFILCDECVFILKEKL